MVVLKFIPASRLYHRFCEIIVLTRCKVFDQSPHHIVLQRACRVLEAYRFRHPVLADLIKQSFAVSNNVGMAQLRVAGVCCLAPKPSVSLS